MRLRVGVVGGTGIVGAELLDVIERRRLPVGELLPFSSGRAKKFVRFRGKTLPAPAIDESRLRSCRLVFFVSSDEISRRLAPRLTARGVFVIDDSSAFRLSPQVPLVIPEINAAELTARRRLIAGPNCTMAPIAIAGWPLHRRFGARELRLASYQSVSGAGRAALEEFLAQTRAAGARLSLGGRVPSPRVPAARALPRPAAFNVFPQVGGFNRSGESSEELKVAAELRKVWGAPGLRVSATAVRVPVLRGHALAAWLSFGRRVTPAAAESALRRAPGISLARGNDYPTPLSAAGRDPVFVGRLRRGATERELCLWVVGDNLLKGAALNSVQIAEELLRRRLLA